MFRPRAPIDAAKDAEPFRRSGLEMIEMHVHQGFAPSTVKIDVNAHVGGIQGINQFSDRPLIPATAEWRSKMVMSVDHRKARLVNAGFTHRQPGDRLEIVKKYIL